MEFAFRTKRSTASWLPLALLLFSLGAAPASATDHGAGAPLALLDATRAVDAPDGGEPVWDASGAIRVTTGPRARVESEVQPAVSTVRDDLVLHTAAGDEFLTHGEDRFFDARLSPDGRLVVFVGLVSGVHVLDIGTRELTHPGPGTRPTWTPDSRWVIFERTTDDGARLTGSELVAHRVADGLTFDLTATPDIHERRPAVSPDGTRVAYLREGAVWVARLQETER